ncbi:unnamed protein product [Hyaloperonospora brassicae]|uniref:Very-long-chain 3-oxoacyl-CoA synthase n=1 Tax=Hyaloperonospora brassicae TaxID=162125 RepID=A0AAV0TE15_HYABA|nr:unnamed protein product [Hyaloperonospora brassicae]
MTNPWNYVSAMFCGFFVMSQLYPMVKKRVPESSGWDHTAATFTVNMFGLLLVVYSVVFVKLWQAYYAGNLQVAQGIVAGTNDPVAAKTNWTHRIVTRSGGVVYLASRRRARKCALSSTLSL